MPPGRRPVSKDFLEAVRDAAHEDLESGALRPSLKEGIAAQKALDMRASRDQDRDLMLRISLALTGRVRIPIAPPDPNREAIEGEFRELLAIGSGAE